MGAIGKFGPIGDYEILTTANDTTTVLDGTVPAFDCRNKNLFCIAGTGVLQVYSLGDARRYRNGKPFVFANNTPEFVGVVAGAAPSFSVFHRVPPRAVCECVLMDNSTAAGVWWSMVHDPAVSNPAYGLSVFEDFNADSSKTLGANFLYLYSGTSAITVTLYNNCLSEPGKQGTSISRTGTTATGYAGFFSGSGSGSAGPYLTGGCRAYEVLQATEALSIAAEEFIVRHGPHNNITGGAPTRGCYLVYDRVTWGDVWVMRNINVAGNTSIPTAVAPNVDTTGAVWQKLRVEIDSAATRSDFLIDNVLVSAAGGLATNIPISTDMVKSGGSSITKSNGINHRHIYADYARVQSYPTALR
jgi:hypothetical protein